MVFEGSGACAAGPLLEELWLAGLRLAPTGIFVAAANGTLLEANPRLCEITGRTREELLQRSLSDWLQTDRPMMEFLGSCTPPASLPCQVRNQEGNWNPYQMNLQPLAGGGFLAVMQCTRESAEQALQESEFFLHRSQAVARIGSYRLDIARGVWKASPGLDELFGIAPGSRTDLVFWGELIHPEDRDAMLRYFQEDVVGRHERFDREYRIIRKDNGEVRWVHGLGELEFDPQDVPRGMIGTIQDITERKQAQQALRDSEVRYRLLFDSNPQPMWVLDAESLAFLNVNEAAIKAYGYSREEFLRMTIREIRPPEDVPFVVSHLARLGEGVDVIQVRHRRKDGAIFDVEIVSHFLMYEGRKARLALGSDITERKRAQEALRDSEARYRLLFEENPQPLWVHDWETLRFLNVNQAAIEKYGYSRDEFLSMTIKDLRPPGNVASLIDHLAHIGEGIDRLQVQHQRKDGTLFDVEIVSHFLMYEGRKARLALASDITERKQAQEALRDSEARYRLLFDSSPQPLYVHDCETLAFLNVNEAMIRNYGYSREEFLRMTIQDIRPPEQIPGLLDHFAQVKSGFDNDRRQHKKKDGTVFEVEIVAHPLNYEGHEARLALATDITERLQAEAALRDLEQQLFQAQKMDAIGRLAGGVAHDFNNHLTVILAHCQLLLAQLDPQDPIAARIKQVLRAGDQSAQLTQQLLAFSRKQVLQPRTFCPNEAVTDIVRMLDRVIGEHIELVTQLDPELGCIEADPTQINQVLMNLAVNARDAMPKGGTILIETANALVTQDDNERLPQLKPGHYVLMTVSDNGTGMDKATLERIFEPFFTTKAGAGTGLGLAMVYGIVRQSGGAISAHSEAGRGTTFSIYFPRVDAVESLPESGPQSISAGGSETILVVEDNEDLRLLTVSILEDLGYHVLHAANGVEAIDTAGGHAGRIHLMITDVVMPRMTGSDLARHMARLRPDMKVLFTSGYAAEVIAPEGALAPGFAYLPKPFTPSSLAEKVRHMIEAS